MSKKIIILISSIAVFIVLAFAVFTWDNIFVGSQENEPEKKLWGAYCGPEDNLQEFEQAIGKPVDIQATFVHWGNNKDFPSEIAKSLKPAGKTLLIYWEAMDYNAGDIINQPNFSYKEILNGKWDSYITSFAKAAKEYGGKVIIVPFEEMNGDWYPWSGTQNGNTVSQAVQAYRRVHDLFKGADNVQFGWSVNNDSVPDKTENDIVNYYPGSDYVDYVGVDGFNFGDPWQTFEEIFNPSLSKLKAFQKPIFIFSMACAKDSQKGKWIADAINKIKTNSDIAGWIWFNENKEENWLVWSNYSALKAFQDALK